MRASRYLGQRGLWDHAKTTPTTFPSVEPGNCRHSLWPCAGVYVESTRRSGGTRTR